MTKSVRHSASSITWSRSAIAKPSAGMTQLHSQVSLPMVMIIVTQGKISRCVTGYAE